MLNITGKRLGQELRTVLVRDTIRYEPWCKTRDTSKWRRPRRCDPRLSFGHRMTVPKLQFSATASNALELGNPPYKGHFCEPREPERSLSPADLRDSPDHLCPLVPLQKSDFPSPWARNQAAGGRAHFSHSSGHLSPRFLLLSLFLTL